MLTIRLLGVCLLTGCIHYKKQVCTTSATNALVFSWHAFMNISYINCMTQYSKNSGTNLIKSMAQVTQKISGKGTTLLINNS